MENEKNYIKRRIDSKLLSWLKAWDRKPILLRGAPQVGKSASIRNLAKYFPNFLEVNFENDKKARKIFNKGDLSPQRLCSQLADVYKVPIVPGETLLFFDEVQCCPSAIFSLHFFYEDYPTLHVIAAGSMLEPALESVPPFGLSRIRTLFMYPLSFAEFLDACGYHLLQNAIERSSIENPLQEHLHLEAIEQLQKFLMVGGMPEVVRTYVETKDLHQCQLALDDLIETLCGRFAQYNRKLLSPQIFTMFDLASKQIGAKFMLSKSDQTIPRTQLEKAQNLLIMTGLFIPIRQTSTTGLPLGAQVDPKKQKMLLIDSGISQRMQGLELANALLSNDFNVINKGNIAELFVGLELVKAYPSNCIPSLYYWKREGKSTSAEVDYVIQKDGMLIPIEVKPRAVSTMKSMSCFLTEENTSYGIRSSLENFAQYPSVKAIPLYAIESVLK
jgi:predicted AAA+ superfamily ATPase